MGTKIRLTALVLAASLTMNMVIMPVKAEDIAAPIEQLESEPVESIAAQTESSEPTSPTTESSEPTSPTTESSEPTSPTTESSEPGAGEESSDLPEQLLTPEEEETLLEETGESMLFSTLTRATDDISEQLKALAEENAVSLAADQEIEIRSGAELYFLAKNVDAAIYQNSTLKFTNSQDGFDVSGYVFPGLGTTNCPFNGTIAFADGSKTEFILKKPLFQCLYDSAQMPELILHYAEESSNTPVALFAQEVKRDPNSTVSVGSPVEWSFTLQGDALNKDVKCTPPLIGIIEAGSSVSLGLTDLINLPVETAENAGLLCGRLNGSLTLTSLSKSEPISVKATDAAGGLVGEMGANGSLTVNLNPVTENDIPKPATLKIKDVSATGNAGGLVGKMVAGATLTINTDVEISGSVTASGGGAGGLVGLAEYSADSLSTVTIKAVTSGGNEPVINSVLTLTGAISSTSSSGGGLIGSATDIIFDGGLPMISGTGSISGANAGGLIGSYTYSGTVNNSLSTVSQNISGITVNGSSNAGGVFGVLRNNSTFTINPTIPDAGTDAVSVTFGGGSTGNVGGLIGNYQAGNLENAALYLAAQAVTSALTSSATTYGGLIGLVGDQDNGVANYIEIGTTQTTTTVTTASGASATDFGGLIAKLTNSGHMVKTVGAVKVINSLPGSSTCGGLVGYMPSGVLWLGGSVDVTGVTTGGNILQNRGWILGSRDNTLVFTDQPNWNYAKGNNTNDIGNWGQVLSIPNICTNSTDDLLTVADHKVTVAAATSGDNTYSIGSPLEFAAIALRLQLDNQETGALNIPDDFSGDLNITLTSDIVLSGTGLTGFQRDYEIGNAAPSVTLTGTKEGSGAYSITLPDITVYIRDNSHKRQGLITKASSLTVTNLEITTPERKSFKAVAQGGSNYYIGALAAEVTGKIDLTNVTGSAVLDITGSGSDSAAGGLIAAETQNSRATISFENCTWSGTITSKNGQAGLYMGGLLGRVKELKAHTVTITGCIISGTMTWEATAEARMGAMIGSLIGASIDNPLTLTIDGLTVSATVTSNASQHTGALLSYEWYRTNATVKNVTVTNSKLTAKSPFGGLVYKGSGYWSIQPTTSGEGESATTTPGIAISNSSFTGTGSSGLLVCHAEETADFGALYLEILYGGYKIENNVTVTGVSTFDEIAGCTIGGTGNGIVSIATKDHEKIDQDSPPNTYVNQLKSYNFTNGNTRYYYNLDSFGAAGDVVEGRTIPSGNIDSPEKMVMFSAYSHADDSIKGYFYSNPGNITNPTDGIIDLTGYSYYPAEQFVDISGATIKFAFKDINDKEEGNKPLDDSNRQHYGMHTGIFRNVVNSGDSDATLRVTNLTLQGSVGHVGGRSGALICGDVHGNSTKSKKMILEIDGVTLDGIAVSPAPQKGTVAPLLINSLGSYTTLNMSGVVTAGYAADVTAASSLIGPVGSDTGAAINLTFSDMALDGIQQADGKTYNGTNSIFSRALFLESFRYSESNCSGVYNFGVDATRYTVGQELSNTGGGDVDGRNNGAQYWFHNSEMPVCGDDDRKTTFYKDYLRYVNNVEGSPDAKSHEIDVNVHTFGLTKGCGTYSHPYIITDGNQLKELAEVLNSGGKKEGWKVNLSAAVIDKSFSNQNGHTASSSEEDIDCVTYTGGKDEWSGTKGGTTYKAANDVVLQYLRNAYYVIRGPEDSETKEITLSGTWAGLGGSETTKAFSGVIVGENDVTVKIVRSDLGQQFGGLIKFSQGSVVKNLKIAYTETPTVTANGVPTTSDASFFGGVVGWCIGGDTIIDNVTVTYQNGEPAVSGNNGHLTAVGGYVGMVGGAINDAGDNTREKYGGGVVFRGDISGGLGGKSDNYFYYNPYVGRVLDGYVLSEKTKLDNTDDNYQIPQISEGKTLTRATVDGKDTVTVTDADDLWLLSAIANSGAGAMTDPNCLAYNVGKPRTGTYANVGGELKEDAGEWRDEAYLGGKATNKTTSYLTEKYTTGNFSNLCSSGVSIVLNSDCDMSGYGNGFRGIGASYATNANDSSNYRLIPVRSITSVEGKTCIITLGQDRKEYTDEKDNWTSIGSGLFVLLNTSGSFSASNLKFKGSTGITYYTGKKQSVDGDIKNSSNTVIGSLESGNRLSFVGAGLLAGNLAKNGTVNNFSLDGISLTGTSDKMVTVNGNGVGSTNAGGLIGALWNNGTITNVTLTDCTMDNVAVSGRMNVGGFIGYINATTTSINYSQDKTLMNIQTTSTQISPRNDNTYGACGVGGLIGYNKSALTINASNPTGQTEPPRLTLENLTVTNSVNNTDTADKSHAGGLVGLWVEAIGGTAKIINVSMAVQIVIIGGGDTKPNTSLGGLAGAIQWQLGTWNDDGGNCSLQLKGLRIASENNSSMTIKNARQVGGLFGMAIIQNSFTIDDVIIGGDGCPVTISNTYGMNNQSIAALIGIALDAQNLSITNTQIIKTNVLVKGDGDRGAGLVVGFVQNGPAKIELRNLTLRDSAVVTQNENLRTGLLYGRIDSSHAHTITGANILVKNCVSGLMLKSNSNSYDLYDGTMDTFTPSKDNVGLNIGGRKPYSVLTGTPNEVEGYTSDRKGIWGGDSGGKTVKLVGVSIQQQENTLPMKDFGTAPSSGSYVVRADYTGAANGDASKVTISPLSPLGTLPTETESSNITITGDGASFVKDTTTPVGDQILADLKTTTDSAGAKIQPTNLNLKHSAALAYDESTKTAYTYLLENSGKAFFGDFKQQGGNADYSDITDASKVNFPVLTLVTNSSVDANKLIYSWISLLTNRTINDTVVSASGSDVSIAVTRWKWSASGWTTDDTEKLPLKFDGKTFSLNKGVYDSGQNRFTLLDVAFADPADSSKTAYHLYIPVIVQKMLRFRFWASAQTGTTYIKSSYMQQEALAAASHGQQVTVLMGFEYKRTQAEWQEAVNNGDNLLFGFEKTIQLEGTSLPDGTRLTLVDCANQNKVYYAKGSEIEDVQGNRTKHNLSFTKFDGWSPVNLCDMLELSVGTSPGQYYQLKNVTTEEAAKAADATLRVWNGTGYDYYKYYAEEDANRPEGTGVSITVDWNPKTVDDFLREQYYLTIQTPDAESAICNNQIVCSNSLNRAELLPTLRENNESGNKYTRNGNENRVLIGDFFTQNVKINADGSNPEMSTVNHVIQATLTSEIKFSSLQSAEMYKAYAEGQNLFQSFDLRMQKTEKAGEQAQRTNLVPGTRITAAYFLGDTPVGMKTYTIARSTPSFRLDFPAGVDVGNWDAQNGATFKAELTLEYPDAAILAQFPLINGDPGNLGVNLGTSSYLAYTQEALPTTTIHDDAGWDANNFYRRDFKAASLNYYPVKRTENSTTESVNQLGVNGWNQQNGPINSAATYDASALDGAGNAKTLRCTLSLKRKTADGGYEAVDGWEKYLAEGSVPTVSVYYNTSGVKAAVASSTLSGNDYTTQFELADYEKDVPIEIRVDMNVLTGAGFEAEGKALTYANYKVEMCVELLDSTGKNVIAGSRAEDYIVYTNARINPNPIRE